MLSAYPFEFTGTITIAMVFKKNGYISCFCKCPTLTRDLKLTDLRPNLPTAFTRLYTVLEWIDNKQYRIQNNTE